MAKRPRVHWTIPTTIALAFVAGLLFATGHHVFYASLGGTPVDDGIFDQQQNLAIGNAFAFLVRPVLVISIGATYWQIFWPTLLNKSFPLETADALAALLSSIIDILSPKAWLASPLLVFIAAIAWLIPFATIVPPATLTVRLRLRGQTGYRLMHMQSPNFLGVSMGENIAYWNDDNEDSYNSNTYYGTTNYLARAVTGTALDGQLPKLPSPAINASYILSYPAPSLQFGHRRWAAIRPFSSITQPKTFSACFSDRFGDYWWPFLAWAPDQDHGLVPFANNSLLKTGDLPLSNLTTDGISDSGFLGSYNSAAANLSIAPGGAQDMPYDNYDIVWSPLNCSLYNSTYRVNFTFQEGTQTVAILDVNITNPIRPLWNTELRTGGQHVSQADVANMNYQALMDSLGRRLVGDISRDGEVYQTQILRTELAFTKEMYPVYNLTGYVSADSNASQWYGKPLATAIENLFQNMTLSLFSRSEFLKVPDDSTPTNVTITTLRNVYTYDWQRLWLSYGLALAFALIIVIIGCSSLAITKASYSNKLSTILRTTGGDRVGVDVKELDRAGRDPLPEYLGKAHLLLCRSAKEVPGESHSEESVRVIPRKPLVASATSAMISPRESLGEDRQWSESRFS